MASDSRFCVSWTRHVSLLLCSEFHQNRVTFDRFIETRFSSWRRRRPS
jgi:hypothetical protein